MDLIRRVEIVTPDCGVLDFELAGPGSRFAALLIDLAVQALLLLLVAAAALLPFGASHGQGAVAAAAVRFLWPAAAVAGWLILWAWPVCFEVLAGGRTPGKRALGLRVVRDDGRAVDWTGASLRNIVRYVDVVPFLTPYLLGGLVMLLDRRHRRLGDLVAGTLVVRERQTPWLDRILRGESVVEAAGPSFTAAQVDRLAGRDAEVVSRYLDRRDQVPFKTRRRLAIELVAGLARRIGAVPSADGDAEAWLEALWSAWLERRRQA